MSAAQSHTLRQRAQKAGANSCASKGDVQSKPSESMSNNKGARPKAINSSVDIAAVKCKRNTIVLGKSTCNELSPCIVNTRQRPINLDDSDTMCDFDCVVDDVPEVHLSTLNYIDVVISGNVYKALIDSGAELPLIKSSLVKDVSSIGNINIQPIVGKAVPASLAVFDVARFDNSVEDCNNIEGGSRNCQRPLHLVFAVTDLATHDVVLPASVVHELSETSHKSTALCKDYESSIKVCSSNVDTLQTLTKNDNISDDSVNQDIEENVNVDQMSTCDVNIADISNPVSTGSREQLIEDQMSDVSLKSSRSLAERKRGGYRWIDGILFHYMMKC